jgi:hypothetical protein
VAAQVRDRVVTAPETIAPEAATPERICPNAPARTVEIREADPAVNRAHHDRMRRLLIESVDDPNTTILLGPNVVLDFTTASNDELPLSFGPCVTLTSANTFRPDTLGQRTVRAGANVLERAAKRWTRAHAAFARTAAQIRSAPQR